MYYLLISDIEQRTFFKEKNWRQKGWWQYSTLYNCIVNHGVRNLVEHMEIYR
jgi:hypothetical protein